MTTKATTAKITQDAKVSVIIPVYNKETVFKRCIESIVGQTYKNLEILLYDDKSTDGSLRVMDEYAARDNRIRVMRGEKNVGPAEARNILMAESTGDFIAWQDADDASHFSRIERQLTVMAVSQRPLSRCCKCYKRRWDGEAGDIQYVPYPVMYYREDLMMGTIPSFIAPARPIIRLLPELLACHEILWQWDMVGLYKHVLLWNRSYYYSLGQQPDRYSDPTQHPEAWRDLVSFKRMAQRKIRPDSVAERYGHLQEEAKSSADRLVALLAGMVVK